MRCYLCVVVLLCFYNNSVLASGPGDKTMSFRLGYLNSGLIHKPVSIDSKVREFNNDTSTYIPLKMPDRMQGYHVGFSAFKKLNNHFMLVYHADWYSRRMRSNLGDSYREDTRGTSVRYKVKINSLNVIGLGIRHKYFELYGSVLDVTITTLAKKEAGFEGFFARYKPLFDTQKQFNFGQTLHAAILPIGKSLELEVRGIYQTFWFVSNHGAPFRPANFTWSANISYKFNNS